jgi:hypothetical protein
VNISDLALKKLVKPFDAVFFLRKLKRNPAIPYFNSEINGKKTANSGQWHHF